MGTLKMLNALYLPSKRVSMMAKTVEGFSKKSKEEKIDWLVEEFLEQDSNTKAVLMKYWNEDIEIQKLHDDFIENTLSNFYLPFGIAPNFVINDVVYAIPMVIEESSVVAAASNAAKFWLDKGGFKAEVISTSKNGQVHLHFTGPKEDLFQFFSQIKSTLQESISSLERSMKERGGGLKSIALKDCTEHLENYFQIHAVFETKDAMGANFINSCLEQIATTFEKESLLYASFQKLNQYPEVVMSILSNYVPECLVRAEVSCPVDELTNNGTDGASFAENFIRAVDIAKVEPRRAVTHNKGIMNGIDAVVLATGNDFRAVEAGVHAYAARNGMYQSLTHASIDDGLFRFYIEIPLALGTVGGLTALHPLVKIAFEILQKPSAEELMKIVAVAGLAQNFAALRSLITTGIQKGHMKMHLMNILNQLKANDIEKMQAVEHFKHHAITYRDVDHFLKKLRD
jgi:hydroxymethylglutaryl-CoA reductase